MSSSSAPKFGKVAEPPIPEAASPAHTISRSVLRAREMAQIASGISADPGGEHEKMSAARAAQESDGGNDGDSRMAASGSWFRRLWKSDADDAVSVVPAPEVPEPNHISPQSFSAAASVEEETSVISSEDVATIFQDAPQPAAEAVTPPITSSGAFEASSNPEAAPQLTQAAIQQTPDPISAPVSEPVLATPPVRTRPARPLTYQQLVARSTPPVSLVASAEAVSGSHKQTGLRDRAPGRPEAESRPVNDQGPASPRHFDSSASRRSVNPFDRPSLYRPPSLDSDKHLDPADLAAPANASGGRWDPIPTLRPSGWRDSGSFRAAGSRSSEDPWSWTTGDGQRDLWKESEQAEASTQSNAGGRDDAETPLTRQWGLLSRFQQARGLGPPARRQNPADDSSASHEAATTAPTQSRRKG